MSRCASRSLAGVATLVFAAGASAQDHAARAMGADRQLMTMFDRLEHRWADEGADALLWDAQGWYGGDINRFVWKSEGDIEDGDVGEAEVQLLWSRAITPFFDLQAGARQDVEPDDRTYGVLGVQGLAPYWFEIDAAAFFSDDGDLSARVEAEYDLLLTQRLVLQPRIETAFAAAGDPARDLGAGLTGVDVGLRLRYEIQREFAPYVGVSWSHALGETADLLRAAGEPDATTAVVAGLRVWF